MRKSYIATWSLVHKSSSGLKKKETALAYFVDEQTELNNDKYIARD